MRLQQSDANSRQVAVYAPTSPDWPLGHYSQGSSSTSTEYLYLPTASGPMPVAVQTDSGLYAIEADHLNTPRRLINSQNLPIWQWPLSGFGEAPPNLAAQGFRNTKVASGQPIGNASNINFRLRYPGQVADSTGL